MDMETSDIIETMFGAFMGLRILYAIPQESGEGGLTCLQYRGFFLKKQV